MVNASDSAIGQDCVLQQAPTIHLEVDEVSRLLTKLRVADVSDSGIAQDCALQAPPILTGVDGVFGFSFNLSVG